jgi:hypothetical protein
LPELREQFGLRLWVKEGPVAERAVALRNAVQAGPLGDQGPQRWTPFSSFSTSTSTSTSPRGTSTRVTPGASEPSRHQGRHSLRASPSRNNPASLCFSSCRHFRLPMTPRSGVPGRIKVQGVHDRGEVNLAGHQEGGAVVERGQGCPVGGSKPPAPTQKPRSGCRFWPAPVGLKII